LGISTSRLNEIIRGRRGITGDTALRLGRATNTTPEFWMNLQALYDLETAREKLGSKLDQVTPVKETVVH
jgi:addiction module HigA family antidote